MKKSILSLSVLLTITANLLAQNVGIGTTAPLMKLHVAASDSAVALLQNTQPLNPNVSTALYFKTGSGFFPVTTGAIKTIGESNNTARLGLFTKASLSPNQLEERLSIGNNGNVGIGTTTPDASAVLDLSASNKGILLPRVALQSYNDVTTVPSPAQYLVVYNTTFGNVNGLSGPGLYTNAGTSLAPVWDKAATGATGATGPQGPAIQTTTGFITAYAGNSIAGGSAAYVFLGTNTVTVTTTATQKILLWGEVPLGTAVGTPDQLIRVGAGYQSAIAGSPIQNMAGINYSNCKVGSPRRTISFAGRIQPGAGTWIIGPAIQNAGANPLTDNDVVNAIYMVVE